MRYVKARFDEYNRDEAYRTFISESLRLAPQGQYITMSLYDYINGAPQVEKTADDIVKEVMQKAELRFE